MLVVILFLIIYRLFDLNFFFQMHMVSRINNDTTRRPINCNIIQPFFDLRKK